MFNKIVCAVKPQGASLWGARLAVGWLGVTVVGLIFDLWVSGCNATRCDLFFTLFTAVPGIPLFAGVWALLHAVLGAFTTPDVFIELLMFFFAAVTMYALGAFAEYVYYK